MKKLHEITVWAIYGMHYCPIRTSYLNFYASLVSKNRKFSDDIFKASGATAQEIYKPDWDKKYERWNNSLEAQKKELDRKIKEYEDRNGEPCPEYLMAPKAIDNLRDRVKHLESDSDKLLEEGVVLETIDQLALEVATARAKLSSANNDGGEVTKSIRKRELRKLENKLIIAKLNDEKTT